MDCSVPESVVLGFEICDQLRDVAPNGVSGYVGVHCSGEEELFVDELVEDVDLFGVW